ncbi:hypothetical protein JTE90_026274 [Oedothorax gibbosus]|uniref:mRNA decay factor PAT1 domain-containing protein n=1 Tax=Oedothorax gibbosus TaxID=931172 RepID=A0AAV6U2V9_9ARAC|nr:hypothetical protein JTE90_026274 [Oedothorax gibbosus]
MSSYTMADNFFGFETDFPSKITLGRKGLEEELLTDVVEEEYDTLNDETFGQATDDDWEEAHEKLSELIVERSNLSGNSVFNDSLLENDESQDEIISKSISQLGLEDDLDDPAIMTVARNCNSLHGRIRSYRSSSSPPPPAFLETESCGSPKTHSIWSTTPKDSGITSFLQSLNHTPTGISQHETSTPVKLPSDNVFVTPPKAWRAEDLEKDLLASNSSQNEQPSTWPKVPHLPPGHLASSPSQFPLGQNHNKFPTIEEVEKQMMHPDPRLPVPGTIPQRVLPPPGLPPGMMPGVIRTNVNAPNHSPIMPMRPPLRAPMLGAMNGMMPNPYFANARMNMMHNQMQMRGPLPNLPPGFNPSNLNMNHKLLGLQAKNIAHPLLQKQFQFPMVVYNNSHYENEEMRHPSHDMEDEYAGLMTQREKEWLLRIQLLQLKSENPYVEDYYFTTQVARRCQKKYSESANKGGGDAPELILPETTKHENKAFVPTQFEGSLGKLQAVSVNFPRKVLDWAEKRPLEDEDAKNTNQNLVKHRKLLLDIEQLYRHFLEIEDEERRILAKPESESGQHRDNITNLKKNIVGDLLNSSVEDHFLNIMTIRKGRSLVMRCFKIFNEEQKLKCLTLLFRCLPVVLKTDRNDLVLVRHTNMIASVIQTLRLSDIVQLGEALKDSLESGKGKEKSSFSILFKTSFGSSVTCTLLTQAESLYGEFNEHESDIKTRWTSVVLNIVDSLSSLPASSMVFPDISCHSLLSHFQRFIESSDKLDLLKEKLLELESKSKPKEPLKDARQL